MIREKGQEKNRKDIVHQEMFGNVFNDEPYHDVQKRGSQPK
jgi:hypothetical protein